MWQTDRQTDRRLFYRQATQYQNAGEVCIVSKLSTWWAPTNTHDSVIPNLHANLSTTATTHTHPFNGPMSRWAGTRKVKPIWILLKQQTVSGTGISWAICKSAPCSRQITTPAPHHSVCLQAGCPSCRPTNSVKALKALYTEGSNLSTTSATNTHKSQPGQSRLC